MVLECDLETHGFVFVDWAGNPSDDPAWAAAYLDRMERTVERDKNHASVVVWSLGNEAGTGRNLAAMADWVHGRDPSRPVHYEGDHSCSYTDLYSRMYPNYLETAAIGTDSGFVSYLHGPAEALRVRARPTVLCEYVHAMGNGPGRRPDVRRPVRGAPAPARRVRVGVARPRAAGARAAGRARSSTRTAATSARSCTTATSSWTGWCCRTGRRRRAWRSGAR